MAPTITETKITPVAENPAVTAARDELAAAQAEEKRLKDEAAQAAVAFEEAKATATPGDVDRLVQLENGKTRAFLAAELAEPAVAEARNRLEQATEQANAETLVAGKVAYEAAVREVEAKVADLIEAAESAAAIRQATRRALAPSKNRQHLPEVGDPVPVEPVRLRTWLGHRQLNRDLQGS